MFLLKPVFSMNKVVHGKINLRTNRIHPVVVPSPSNAARVGARSVGMPHPLPLGTKSRVRRRRVSRANPTGETAPWSASLTIFHGDGGENNNNNDNTFVRSPSNTRHATLYAV